MGNKFSHQKVAKWPNLAIILDNCLNLVRDLNSDSLGTCYRLVTDLLQTC